MKIVHIIGRLGMGRDTRTVLNSISAMKKIHDISDWQIDFITHDIGYNEQTVRKLESAGFRVFILNGDVRKSGVVKYFFDIYRFLKENGKYDVIHVHTSFQSAVALTAAGFAGVHKRICHAHTIALERDSSKIKKAVAIPVFRFLIGEFSNVKIACSEYAGKYVLGNKKFTVLYNGIDIEKYKNVEFADTRNQLINSQESYVVGYVARFSKVKNQKFIIELAEKMKDQNDIKFVLVGDGELYSYYKKQIDEKKINVLCTGRRNDIPALMQSFDMMLIPSLAEGFSITLLEAQACMCSCLCSDKLPRTADIGLKLVKYLPLENKELWINEIQKRKPHNHDNHNALSKIHEIGMDEADIAEKLYNIYTQRG